VALLPRSTEIQPCVASIRPSPPPSPRFHLISPFTPRFHLEAMEGVFMTSVGATKAMTSPTRPAQGQRNATLVGARGAPHGHDKPKVCGCALSPQHAHGACY
jgi:hypothetical protein